LSVLLPPPLPPGPGPMLSFHCRSCSSTTSLRRRRGAAGQGTACSEASFSPPVVPSLIRGAGTRCLRETMTPSGGLRKLAARNNHFRRAAGPIPVGTLASCPCSWSNWLGSSRTASLAPWPSAVASPRSLAHTRATEQSAGGSPDAADADHHYDASTIPSTASRTSRACEGGHRTAAATTGNRPQLLRRCQPSFSFRPCANTPSGKLTSSSTGYLGIGITPTPRNLSLTPRSAAAHNTFAGNRRGRVARPRWLPHASDVYDSISTAFAPLLSLPEVALSSTSSWWGGGGGGGFWFLSFFFPSPPSLLPSPFSLCLLLLSTLPLFFLLFSPFLTVSPFHPSFPLRDRISKAGQSGTRPSAVRSQPAPTSARFKGIFSLPHGGSLPPTTCPRRPTDPAPIDMGKPPCGSCTSTQRLPALTTSGPRGRCESSLAPTKLAHGHDYCLRSEH